MPLDNGTLNILYHKQEEFVSTFAFRETLKKMSLVARGGGVCVCVIFEKNKVLLEGIYWMSKQYTLS